MERYSDATTGIEHGKPFERFLRFVQRVEVSAIAATMQQAQKARERYRAAIWRRLTSNDIDNHIYIADAIHPGLPESAEVFAERVKLFPEGCLALTDRDTDKIYGYAITHPIRYRQPPALDSFLGEVSPAANQYYIHDLTILPDFQGRGYAHECIEKLFMSANRYATACLVSVYGTASFWTKYDFLPTDTDETMAEKICAYGEEAVYLERRNNVQKSSPT
ncbi:hypothetical protein CC86DRAFT_354003 [Ophiobolus disseminans]|uniref:N-acetyltransferase domain-containing protein n=1 Tax=Ophiobolus disseminans TaxID=1469910 RepID=A0A6A6ZSY3_9PLEO|nr:hypothetical protein CC86DRAFT_354003 [Ophiobolus disseminans]